MSASNRGVSYVYLSLLFTMALDVGFGQITGGVSFVYYFN